MTRLITFLSILMAGLVLFCGTAAFADSDPHIIIGPDPACTSNCSVTGDTFTISLTTSPDDLFTIQNSSGSTWLNLFLYEDTVGPAAISISGCDPRFTLCQAIPNPDGNVNAAEVQLLNVCFTSSCTPIGIPSGSIFTLDFGAVGEGAGTDSWPSNTVFSVVATPAVPEPGFSGLLLAELLVFAGMLGFAGRSRVLKALS